MREVSATSSDSERLWGDWGEKEGDIVALTEVLVVRGPRAIGFRLTPRRVVPDPHASEHHVPSPVVLHLAFVVEIMLPLPFVSASSS